MRAGIDVGGTFTDLVLWDGAELRTGKVPTTPADQSEGVLAALRAADAGDVELVHGTTVATNALLERTGARTALVTDTGFEDLIEIGRQDRPSLYDVEETRSRPLVDRKFRIGVPHRSGGDELDDTELDDVARKIHDLSPDAVAISTLFSFLDPSREQSLSRAISNAVPEVAISLSSVVAPEFREFERTSTTVINAYLQPIVSRYLDTLGAAAGEVGVVGSPSVMRSSGGLVDLVSASRLPASIVLSGPAGGVVAAAAFGTALGHSSLISFDMGGTSTDVCRIREGQPQVMFERAVGGLPNRMPSVAIHTVGAGGGSEAWLDSGGALRVGPRSAGAVPGPAAYGRGGTKPTVTDADLIVGRLGPAAPRGSSLALDIDLARGAVSRVGDHLGFSVEETAAGISDVVEAHMERAIRVVSVEEGVDPRDAVLVAFGGAGAMHATSLARSLGMAGVVVPPHAGVFAALGLLLAPPRADVVMGVLLEPGGHLDGAVGSALTAAAEDLVKMSSSLSVTDAFVDVRYRGQSHEMAVPYEPGEGWPALAERFHAAHLKRNGFSRPDDAIEVIAVRAAAVGSASLTIEQIPEHRGLGDARRADRELLLGGETFDATVWWRPDLRVGEEVVGPAVIEEAEATTFLGPGERAVVHGSGAFEVGW